MTFRVSADVFYLDGHLSGLTIKRGFSVKASSEPEVRRLVQWINRTRAENDFVRAVSTGDRYQFASPPSIEQEETA